MQIHEMNFSDKNFFRPVIIYLYVRWMAKWMSIVIRHYTLKWNAFDGKNAKLKRSEQFVSFDVRRKRAEPKQDQQKKEMQPNIFRLKNKQQHTYNNNK